MNWTIYDCICRSCRTRIRIINRVMRHELKRRNRRLIRTYVTHGGCSAKLVDMLLES